MAIRDDLIEPEPWTDVKGSTVVPRGKRRIQKLDGVKTFNFDWPEQTEVTTRLRDILESDVDEKYYLDEEKTAKLIAELDGKEFSDNDEPEMVGRVDLKGHDAIKRVYSPNGVGNTLTTMGGGHREPKIVEVRPVLTPDRENKRQEGRRFKENDDPAFTLNTQDRHGVAIGQPPKYRIRKLTPRECFRLQGFSDEVVDALIDAGISDTQLYKMAGNAVTVSVVEAIAERILPLIVKEVVTTQ